MSPSLLSDEDAPTLEAVPRSLRARVTGGVSANALSQALNVVSQLVLVPVFLTSWGAPRYGEWLMLSAIPSAVALADLGLASAGGNEMVLLAARGERARAGRVQQALLACWLGVGALVMTAVSLAALVVPSAFPMAAGCLAAYALLAVLTGLLTAPLNAVRRYALGVHLVSALRAAELIATLVAVVASERVATLCIVLLLVRLAGVVAIGLVMRRVVAWLPFRPSFVAALSNRRLLASGIAFMGFPAGNAMLNQGVLVAIGLTFDAAGVAAFAVMRSLTRLVTQLLNVVILAVQPEVTHAHAQRDLGLMRTLCRMAFRAAFWLGLAACVAVALVGPCFLSVWTHRLVAIDNELLWILALLQLVTCIWFASAIAVVATNRHARLSFRFVLLAALTLPACATAARIGGMHTVAWTLVAAELLMARFAIGQACALTQDSPRAYLTFPLRALMQAGRR